MDCPRSAIVSHGDINSKATEVYGTGPVIVRIGNGGAGATGLIRELANDYLDTLTSDGSIEWVCNHSRNTQLALLHKYIDLALTYERDQEALAAAEGWSCTVGCVMHDHFCLAGPLSDPAGVSDAASVSQALRRIADAGSLFHSRADFSATMWKEHALWQEQMDKHPWYQTSLRSPAEALCAADAAGAYLLTDRSTLLSQVSLGRVAHTTVFFEPENVDHELMNSCYALCAPDATAETRDFAEYLLGDRAQRLIEEYGRQQTGFPLFARAADGFARTRLRGGRPVAGKWVVP